MFSYWHHFGGITVRRSVIAGALLTAGIAAAASLVASTPATADPIYQGHFHDVFTNAPYDCEGTPAQNSGDVYGNFDWNLRGSSPFPFYRESTNGTLVMTNLNTGGTFTDVIAVNSNDHTIIDNGDGTFTLTISSSGGSRFYDARGNFVLKDPGTVRYAEDINYHGTPGDPRNYVEVPGSFRLVKPSTGNSDLSGLDFCALLVKYTS
jgi:hypothetical protein